MWTSLSRKTICTEETVFDMILLIQTMIGVADRAGVGEQVSDHNPAMVRNRF
jgi:hypothetical protein